MGQSGVISNKRDLCNQRDVDITPGCWDELVISQYLERWWRQYAEECGSYTYHGKGFASCYQQKLEILN